MNRTEEEIARIDNLKRAAEIATANHHSVSRSLTATFKEIRDAADVNEAAWLAYYRANSRPITVID